LKIIVCNDFHCGHKLGLTPPSKWRDDLRFQQEPLYEFWASMLKKHGPFDAAIINGDMVDGEGKKDTIGHLTTDTEEQAEMAAEIIKLIPAPRDKIALTYGTPFHTAGTYSYENTVAKLLDLPNPVDTFFGIIDGVRIRARHQMNRSNIPYGQGLPALKELVRDGMEALLEGDERADLVLGAHVHYSFSATLSSLGAVAAVPCLQMPGSVFGRKMASFYYDVGFGIIETDNGRFRYYPVEMDLRIVRKREWVQW